MASFARTIKSPYLSPRLRPSMPGRSMSTSSDQASQASQANPPPPQSPRSGEIIGEFDLSGRNTPAIPSRRPNELQDGFFDLDDIEPRTSYFSGKLALALTFIVPVRNAWNACPISSRLTPDCQSIPTFLSMIFITWPQVSDLKLRAAGRRGYPPADDPGRRRAVLNPAAGIASQRAKSSEARHVFCSDLVRRHKFPSTNPRDPDTWHKL
ncbi:hypothetical protein FNAPI_10469 [Fusarium napiforme]|uniref:Uncharacterized protein n=1 Tax=Fusarium napiforme TaxID=42672 RepID=A0A8H5INW8_9HYPO|nr:hypothetical protein FNAPI_10469 [Fusarium napiforme]